MTAMPVARCEVFGVAVDVVDQAAAIERIIALARSGAGGTVVTPNLDHAIRLRRDAGLRAAYRGAALILADGMPLVWASRLRGPVLPARVAGSDLIEPLARAAAAAGLSLFLFGTTLPVLCRAARHLVALSPGLVIAGAYAPPFGFEADPGAEIEARQVLAEARADIVLLALGTPRQELWAARWRADGGAGVLLCIGAGLDFLAGAQPRAPRALRGLGLEWLWRALRDPFRLGPRYLRNLLWLPLLLAEQLVGRRPSG
jgi:N-acetylglucosaminyldiphosphoundecaprenol N-acetyl-beta-D-mannosaminyltransferase